MFRKLRRGRRYQKPTVGKRLRDRIFRATFTSAVASFFVVAVVFVCELSHLSLAFLPRALESAATRFSDEVTFAGGSREAFLDASDRLHRSNTELSALFIDLKGVVRVAYPALPRSNSGPSLLPNIDALSDTSREQLLHTSPFLGHDPTFVASRATVDNTPGWVVLLLPKRSFPISSSVVLFLGILSVAAILSVFLLRRSIRKYASDLETVAQLATGGSQPEGDGLNTTFRTDEAGAMAARLRQLTQDTEDAEAEIERVEQERHQMLSGIVHDLGAPLTTLNESLITLQNSCAVGTPETAVDSRARFARSMGRLGPLLRRLQTLGDLELQGLEPQFVQADLNQIARRVVESFETTAKTLDVRLEFVKGTEPVLIEIDDELIRRSIENLVSNALRYTRPSGVVITRVYANGGSAYIEVKDDGVGIQEKDLNSIFGEYVTDPALNQDRQRLGLGLALVKRFVAAHRGAVRVESTLGLGSTFTISLPFQRNQTEDVKHQSRSSRLWRMLLDGTIGLAVGLLVGLVPIVLGEPPRTSYVLIGGLVPIILCLLWKQSRSVLSRSVGGFTAILSFSFALTTLRRPELVLLGVGVVAAIAIPFLVSANRSYAVGFALRIASIVMTLFLASAPVALYGIQLHLGEIRRQVSVQNAAEAYRQAQSAFARFPKDPERALYSYQNTAPTRAAALVARDGTVLQESCLARSFERIEPEQWIFKASDSSSFESTVGAIRVFGQNSVESFPATVGFGNYLGDSSLVLLLEPRVLRRLFIRMFDSLIARTLFFGFLFTQFSTVCLYIYIRRLLHARLHVAHRLLTDQPPLLQLNTTRGADDRGDELDEILHAIRTLQRGREVRRRQLRELQRDKCHLVGDIHFALNTPFERLETIAVELQTASSDGRREHKLLQNVSEQLGCILGTLAELRNYVRFSAEVMEDEPQRYRVDEVLNDICAKYIKSLQSLDFIPCHPPLFVHLPLSVVSYILEHHVHTFLARARGPIAVVCSADGTRETGFISFQSEGAGAEPKDEGLARVREKLAKQYEAQIGCVVLHEKVNDALSLRISFPVRSLKQKGVISTSTDLHEELSSG